VPAEIQRIPGRRAYATLSLRRAGPNA